MEGQRRGAVRLAVGLALGTGAMDAITFTRLGNVFSSVMTGNLVLLGVSAGRRDGALAGHVAVAVAGFVLGVLVGSRIAGPPSADRAVWPVSVSAALGVELGVLGVYLAGWVASGGRPLGWSQFALLACAAAAMGIQSAAVRGIGLAALSTTYLTGTLIGLLGQLVAPGTVQWRGAAMLAGLIVGAAGGGLLVADAAIVAPVLPISVLMVVLGVATRPSFRAVARSPR